MLFNITTAKSTDKNKITFSSNGAFEFVGRSSINNGVQGRVNRLSYPPIPKNTFSLVQVGESVCLYRNKEWYASQNIFTLTPLDTRLSEQHIFVVSSINKALQIYSSAYTYPTLEDVKKLLVYLPVNNGDIDFGFIAEFVAELEAQRVAELATYLQATGLQDYTLTEAEQQIITRTYIVWKEYQIGELFERITTNKLPYKAKDLPKQQIGEYTLPCLTSSFMNQGLNYYVPTKGATILRKVISIPSNSDVYRAYYQSNYFTVLSDAYAIRWIDKDAHITDNQYLFMVMCINKITDRPIYSYKNKLGGWNVVSQKNILLPTKDGKIDFEYMETYITAIKKLAIEDVVKFTDRKIIATKEIINIDPL